MRARCVTWREGRRAESKMVGKHARGDDSREQLPPGLRKTGRRLTKDGAPGAQWSLWGRFWEGALGWTHGLTWRCRPTATGSDAAAHLNPTH